METGSDRVHNTNFIFEIKALTPVIIRDYGGTNRTSVNTTVSHFTGFPYMYGSSLKGAFRTAIVYHILKKNPDYFLSYCAWLACLTTEQRRKLSKPSLAIEKFALCGWKDLPDPRSSFEPLSDPMRFMTVTDLVMNSKLPEGEEHSHLVRRVKVGGRSPTIAMKRTGAGYLIQMDDEMWKAIEAGAASTGRIKLDSGVLSLQSSHKEGKLPVPRDRNSGFLYLNRDKLTEACRDFSNDVLDFELERLSEMEHFPEEYSQWKSTLQEITRKQERNPHGFALPVGWGPGWITKTMGILLYLLGPGVDGMQRLKWDNVEALVSMPPWASRLLMSSSGMHRGKFLVPFPRTRRLIKGVSEEHFKPPGWVFIKWKNLGGETDARD